MPEDREPYALFIAPAAGRQLDKLTQDVQNRLYPAIDALADDQTPHGSIKLQGSQNTRRIRVGDYRIIYELDEAARAITVTRVAHRREAYR